MKTWRIETDATVRRVYFIEAENAKDAIAKSCDKIADHEEDINEETVSISEQSP